MFLLCLHLETFPFISTRVERGRDEKNKPPKLIEKSKAAKRRVGLEGQAAAARGAAANRGHRVPCNGAPSLGILSAC